MKFITQLLVVASMTLAFASAQAQQGKLELSTVVEKEQRVVDANGEEVVSLVTADKVVPGDVVVYTVTYTNISDQSVENVVITNPIAAQLTFENGSAFAPGAEVSFSADGGTTWGDLGELMVSDGDAARLATNADLTHIRWVLQGELDTGAKGFARFRARLN